MSHVDLGEILAQLNASIAARRLKGDYPEGLEQQLEAEFDAMMRAINRDEIDTERLSALVEAVITAVHGVGTGVETGSRLPGGAVVHKSAAHVVQRHTGPLAESVRTLGLTIADALRESRRLIDAQRSADERQLLDVISGVLDRLAVLDHLVEITRDLEARVAVLEQSTP
ncbi:MAG: hypothetical protein ACRDIL_00815, partial [Candidatus Limnocylindrales bacterium]